MHDDTDLSHGELEARRYDAARARNLYTGDDARGSASS